MLVIHFHSKWLITQRLNKSLHRVSQIISWVILDILDNKLVDYQFFTSSSKHIYKIVVQSPLHPDIFCVFHSYHTASHMGEYKTLYRVTLQFYWTYTRKDNHICVKANSYCCVTFKWWRRGSELTFSWPISSLYWFTMS